MSVKYRKDRKRWGFRVCRAGISYRRFEWATKAEARQAEAEFLTELKKNPPPPKNSLEAVASEYLIDSAPKRSEWRIKSLRRSFHSIFLPYFGRETLFAAITAKDIERFIIAQKQRGISNNTIWHYKTDLGALYNWAIKEGLASKNPVSGADLSLIRNHQAKKTALDLDDIEFVASVLDGYDRCYFNFMRYTGLRLDEANRARWEDVDLDGGWLDVRGTKTEGSAATIPLAPVLVAELREHRQNYHDSDLIFPGRFHQVEGKQIYSRKRYFQRIQKLTARARYAQAHPELSAKQVEKAVKAEKYQGGVKLSAKVLRDVFGTLVMDNVSNPDITRRLMRHTDLTTTTKYMREVKDRMQDAVKNLGTHFGDTLEVSKRPKKTQNDKFGNSVLVNRDVLKSLLAKGILNVVASNENPEAVATSSADTDPNLLELLAQLVLETGDGDTLVS